MADPARIKFALLVTKFWAGERFGEEGRKTIDLMGHYFLKEYNEDETISLEEIKNRGYILDPNWPYVETIATIQMKFLTKIAHERKCKQVYATSNAESEPKKRRV